MAADAIRRKIATITVKLTVIVAVREERQRKVTK